MNETIPEAQEAPDFADINQTVMCRIEGCEEPIEAFAVCYKCGDWVPVCQTHQTPDAQIVLLGSCLCLAELVQFKHF